MKDHLFRKAPWAIIAFTKDPDDPLDAWKLADCNPAFERFWAVGRADVLGKPIIDLLFNSHEVGTKWLRAFGNLPSSGDEQSFDEMLERRGHYYVVSAFVADGGHLVTMLHRATRYEEARETLLETEHSLAESQALSHAIFHYSPVAIITYDVKEDGSSSFHYTIKDANPACLWIEGWSREDVIGKPLGSVRPAADEFGIIQVFREVWQTGRVAHYPAKVYREGTEFRWYENYVYRLPGGEVAAAYRDVTGEKMAQEELFREKEKLKVTLHSVGDAVIATDDEGRVEIVNAVAEELTGWRQEEAKGLPLTDIFHITNETTGLVCEDPVREVLRSGKTVGLANHTVLTSRSGQMRPIADSAAPILGESGETKGVVLVFRDVTLARARESRIQWLSYRDHLTGLYNRAFFEGELVKLESGPRHSYPSVLIMADVDGLKLINDAFGHQVGDEALRGVARVMKDYCRSTDTVARWGGDEFVILVPGASEREARRYSNALKEATSHIKIAGTDLGVSFGYVVFEYGKGSWRDALKRAEDNMYKSKLLDAKSYRSTILASMKNTLSEKSFETQEHGERMGLFCKEIGTTLGMSPHELDEIQVLAMLHDIGKIAIDERILKKPGALTEEERQAVEKHPEIGYRIAQTVPELSNIADFILAHHERWDGKGYPRGLVGTEIPLSSRILAVVDAYDAITQDRPYRKARSSAEAQRELLRNAGTQFDPNIVHIFLAHLETSDLSGESSLGAGGAN